MEAYEVSRKFADMVIAGAIALRYGKVDVMNKFADRDDDVLVYVYMSGKERANNCVKIEESLDCIVTLSDSNDGELNCKIYLGDNILDVRNVKVETDDSYLVIFIEGKNGEHIFEVKFSIRD